MFRICAIILIILSLFVVGYRGGGVGVNTNTRTGLHGKAYVVPYAEGDALLLEGADYFLLETDDKLLLEV